MLQRFRISRLTILGSIKVLILLIPVVFFFQLLNRRTLLFSDSTITYHPGKRYNQITLGLGQIAKTPAPAPYTWSVIHDSLSIYSWVPRVTETIRFQSVLPPTTADYIELTAKYKKERVVQPSIVWSKALNTLAWPHKTERGVTVWRSPSARTRLENIESVLTSDANTKSKVAVAGLDPYSLIRPKNYSPSKQPRTIDVALRGNQNIYAYAAHEDLQFSFTKRDLNRSLGVDRLTIFVTRDTAAGQQEFLMKKELADDGNSSADGVAGERQEVSIHIPNVDPGMYHVQIFTSTDALIERLTSSQSHVAFANSLTVASGPIYQRILSAEQNRPATLLTNATRLKVVAAHTGNSGSYLIEGRKESVYPVGKGEYKQFSTKEKTFILQQPDVQISLDGGLITFPPFQLPGPTSIPIELENGPDLKGFDYLIAKYIPYQSATEDIRFSEEFSQEFMEINSSRQYTFTLRTPGLVQNGSYLGIKKISITNVRGDLDASKIFSRLKKSLKSI